MLAATGPFLIVAVTVRAPFTVRVRSWPVRAELTDTVKTRPAIVTFWTALPACTALTVTAAICPPRIARFPTFTPSATVTVIRPTRLAVVSTLWPLTAIWVRRPARVTVTAASPSRAARPIWLVRLIVTASRPALVTLRVASTPRANWTVVLPPTAAVSTARAPRTALIRELPIRLVAAKVAAANFGIAPKPAVSSTSVPSPAPIWAMENQKILSWTKRLKAPALRVGSESKP